MTTIFSCWYMVFFPWLMLAEDQMGAEEISQVIVTAWHSSSGIQMLQLSWKALSDRLCSKWDILKFDSPSPYENGQLREVSSIWRSSSSGWTDWSAGHQPRHEKRLSLCLHLQQRRWAQPLSTHRWLASPVVLIFQRKPLDELKFCKWPKKHG